MVLIRLRLVETTTTNLRQHSGEIVIRKTLEGRSREGRCRRVWFLWIAIVNFWTIVHRYAFLWGCDYIIYWLTNEELERRSNLWLFTDTILMCWKCARHRSCPESILFFEHSDRYNTSMVKIPSLIINILRGCIKYFEKKLKSYFTSIELKRDCYILQGLYFTKYFFSAP